MATLVLVHGAWSGSWSWKGVAALLRAAGHEVHAPTLTGLAERSHVAACHINLSSHIADIAGLLRWNDLHDAILIGHSYGGMVITGAADREPDRVAGMIYIDAFVPLEGQSIWDIAGPERAAAQRAAALAHDGGHSVPRGGNPRGADRATEARFGPLFTAHPAGCFAEPFVSCRANPTWPARHFALCSGYDPSPFQTIAARLRADPGWTTSTFDAGHDVVRSQPAEVARRIGDVVTSWGRGAPFRPET